MTVSDDVWRRVRDLEGAPGRVSFTKGRYGGADR